MSQSVRGETFEEPSTSQRVITAVAEETGNDPTEVGPLYHVIDPDALDRLFGPTVTTDRSPGRVEFEFAGCEVVVEGNETVEVTRIGATVDTPDEAETGAHRSQADADGAR